MTSLYNSEGYFSPTEYEALKMVEREERAAEKFAAFRPIVYICSPYSHGCINTNIEKAQKYSRFAVDKHYLPITPHIYFTQFMDDTISAGMKAEIERAERRHMKIRYFTEELEEKECVI